MGVNKNLRFIYFLFILILAPPLAHSQQGSRNQIVRTKDGLIIYQFISFPPIENSLRYDIEVEEARDNDWVLLEKTETADNFFVVSLPAGDYRYRYTAYNRMGLLEGISVWQEFRLLPAVAPQIDSYQGYYAMYREMRDGNVLTVHGADFSDKTEFALVKINRNEDWTGADLISRSDVITPEHAEITETRAVLTFSADSVKRGNYEIFARNPGGLWVSFGRVRAGPQNDVGILLEYGWAPAFGESVFFNYEYARLGFFPLKTEIGNFGLGMQFLWQNRKEGAEYAEINPLPSINIFYQYIYNERVQHNAKIGFMYFPDKKAVYEREHDPFGNIQYNYTGDIAEHNFIINAGYSFQYFFWKNLYASAGADFVFYTNFAETNAFQIHPQIGIGWQFGRWAEQAEIIEGARKGQDYSVPVTRPPQMEHKLSIGWLPMIPMSGVELLGYKRGEEKTDILGNAYRESILDDFLEPFNPAGFNISYAVFPYRWGSNKLGIGINFSILDHKNRNELAAEYAAPDLLSYFIINAHYQRPFAKDWEIGVNAGIGISNPYDYINEFKGPKFMASFGASLQYFVWKNLFIEAGLNANYISKFPWEEYFKEKVIFRPSLSAGWQFGRGGETGHRLPGTGLPF